jgi:hypothetical protein
MALPKTRKLSFTGESHFAQLAVSSVALAVVHVRGPVWEKTGLPPRIDQNQGAGFVGIFIPAPSHRKP